MRKQQDKPQFILANQLPTDQIIFANTDTAIVHVPRKLEPVYDVNGYYEFMGLEPHCTMDEIKRRGRQLAKTMHPDMGGDPEQFIKLQKCLEVLLDPEQRRVYDSLSPMDKFFTRKDLCDLIVSSRVRGDVRPEEEIFRDLGVKTFKGKRETVEPVFYFPFSFYCEPNIFGLTIHEDDLRRLGEWHDMLLTAARHCGWKGVLRVGVRRSIGKAFEVERREAANHHAWVFVLKQGYAPTQHIANVAMAYVASAGDYAKLLQVLGAIEQRSEQCH